MADERTNTPSGIYAQAPTTGGGAGRLNRLIERIAAREPAVGPFSFVRHPLSARALAGSALDFIIIDMEHSPYDAALARQAILDMRAINGRYPVAPLVRVPVNGREVAHNQWVFKQVLDMGALGIMVPQVNSAEEARAAVVAMRYPPTKDDPAPEPRGQRGIGGGAAAWGMTLPDYVRKADLWPLDPDGELLLIVQIETAQAIDDFEAIVSVPGVGGAFVGPADLYADMGYPGQSGVAEVEDRIREVGAKARQLGAYLGIAETGASWAKRREQGFSFFSSSDLGISSGLAADLRALDR